MACWPNKQQQALESKLYNTSNFPDLMDLDSNLWSLEAEAQLTNTEMRNHLKLYPLQFLSWCKSGSLYQLGLSFKLAEDLATEAMISQL